MDQMKTWAGNGGEENGQDYNFRAPLSGKPRPDQYAVDRFRRREVSRFKGAAPSKSDDPIVVAQVNKTGDSLREVISKEGAAPSNSINPDDPAFDNGPVVSAGREAWAKEKEVQGEVRCSRERVFQIGDAINEGQQWAMEQAHTNNPRTRKCRDFFNHWLQVNGFADIDGCPGRDDKKGSGDFGRFMRLAQKRRIWPR